MSENHKSDGPGYEKSDVSVGKVLLYGIIGTLVVVVVVIFVMDFYISTQEELVYEAVLSPESASLRELRAREIEVLNTYELLDSAAGTYRIPIDRAMTLIAAEDARERDSQY